MLLKSKYLKRTPLIARLKLGMYIMLSVAEILLFTSSILLNINILPKIMNYIYSAIIAFFVLIFSIFATIYLIKVSNWLRNRHKELKDPSYKDVGPMHRNLRKLEYKTKFIVAQTFLAYAWIAFSLFQLIAGIELPGRFFGTSPRPHILTPHLDFTHFHISPFIPSSSAFTALLLFLPLTSGSPLRHPRSPPRHS